MRLRRSSRSWSIECRISAASFTFAKRLCRYGCFLCEAGCEPLARFPIPMACCGRRRSRRLPAAIPSSMPGMLAALTYLRGALAPVHAVRGNVDHGAWSANLPVTQRIEIDGFRIYVLHILVELDPQAADKVDAVIYGHSHQPKIETKNATLCFNPGSAGPRRFPLPITLGRMTAEHGKLRAEIVELSVER